METCTKRSLDFLRKQGYKAWITETSMQFPDKKFDRMGAARNLINMIARAGGITNFRPDEGLLSAVTQDVKQKMIPMKRDLFNFADLVGVRGDKRGTTYVQTTTRDHQAERIKKILESEYTPVLLEAGNHIHVHGWAKVGGRAQRKLWKVTVSSIDFVNGSLTPVIIDEQEPESDIGSLFPRQDPPAEMEFGEGEVVI